MLLPGISYLNPLSQPSIGGLDAEEFIELFQRAANDLDIVGANFAPTSYDAVWAAALALNRTLQKMEQMGIIKFHQYLINIYLSNLIPRSFFTAYCF